MLLYIVAVLLFILGTAHSLLGEKYILARLFRRDNLPKLFGGTDFTRQTLRFAWHITTVAWWGLAVLLWSAASDQLSAEKTLSVIGVTMLLSGLLPLIITKGRHLSWLILFFIGAVALWSSVN